MSPPPRASIYNSVVPLTDLASSISNSVLCISSTDTKSPLIHCNYRHVQLQDRGLLYKLGRRLSDAATAAV